MTPMRRRRLHQRAIEVLEATPGANPAELARHAIEAITPPTNARAVTYAIAAGDQALERVAAAAAAEWFQRAVELVPGDDEVTRCDVLLRLGSAYRGARRSPLWRVVPRCGAPCRAARRSRSSG